MLNRIPLLLPLLIFLSASAAGIAVSQTPVPQGGSALVNETAHDKATCAQKWDRYYKSQECFAPYHNVDGTMKPGAFEHCKEIKFPTECPLQPPRK